MKYVNSREAQNNFGDLMNSAIKEPIAIHKYGKPSAVLISHEEYMKFCKLEDLYWLNKAKRAENGGFLSEDETEEFLAQILKS